MKILTIGGTRFAGRSFTEQALAAGHAVTVFHRGRNPAPSPDVEEILGDRATDDLQKLAGRRFDAVLDTCTMFPRLMRASVELLADSGWYGFVSSISAHLDGMPPGSTEDAPLHGEPFPEAESLEHYGPLKVACEREVARVFGDRAAILRPGFIVGPNDPSDRFPSLVRRAAAGGEMLVPGPPGDWLQFVDARDLAAFYLRRAESGQGGVFDLVHPMHTATMAQVLEGARDAVGADTRFTWVDPTWLIEALGEGREAAFPMWGPEDPGFHQLDPRKAVAAGLRCRPIADTIGDTLRWDAALDRATERATVPMHGLTPEREQELLAAWRARAR